MTRVVFLTAPFKARMIEKMVLHFRHIDPLILVPSYPYTKKASISSRMKVKMQICGETSLNRKLRVFNPDLVYSDSAIHAAQVKLSLLARNSIPFVIHLRGDWWREYYSWFASASWRRRALSSLQYSYNWYSLATATKITPICKWLEKVVKHHLPWKRTETVYQGVDPSQFDRTHERFAFEKPAVAIIQNHTVYPKVAGLLRFRDVISNLPSVNFYIAEGEASHQLHIAAVKKTYARLSNVHFVRGIVNPDAVRKMLNSSDLYVLASELDCCPTTVLEASLMGKVVIASRVGGIPELVLENTTGWTIPNGATQLWIEKIRSTLGDRKLRNQFGRNGRKWVAERFAWPRIAAQVERLILDEVSA